MKAATGSNVRSQATAYPDLPSAPRHSRGHGAIRLNVIPKLFPMSAMI